MAAPRAVVVVERSTRSPEPTWPAGLERFADKRYGETTIWFAEPAEPGTLLGPCPGASGSFEEGLGLLIETLDDRCSQGPVLAQLRIGGHDLLGLTPRGGDEAGIAVTRSRSSPEVRPDCEAPRTSPSLRSSRSPRPARIRPWWRRRP